MTGAAHHRGKSKQDYETPVELLDAVRARFDIREFAWDLAATRTNKKALNFVGETEDSLSVDCDWRTFAMGPCWLNPPFSAILPWARKCADSTDASVRRIFFLVPAAVGSNWYAQYVHGKALVLALNGRISFDGKNPYPKDCLLAVYGETPGFDVWRWR